MPQIVVSNSRERLLKLQSRPVHVPLALGYWHYWYRGQHRRILQPEALQEFPHFTDHRYRAKLIVLGPLFRMPENANLAIFKITVRPSDVCCLGFSKASVTEKL